MNKDTGQFEYSDGYESWYQGQCMVQHRNGLHREWTENGTPSLEYRYEQGKHGEKPKGTYRMWYDNGNTLVLGRYRRGNRSGKWRYFCNCPENAVVQIVNYVANKETHHIDTHHRCKRNCRVK